jgi:carbonic anhydrase/acetyltransferase-like protein (isoleucine patch superfamily)
VKKKKFLYPVANIINRFRFGAYGKNVYIGPGVLINRPRYVHLGNHVRIQRNASINLHPSDKKSREGLLFVGDGVLISQGCILSALNSIIIEEDVIVGPNVLIVDSTRIPGDVHFPIKDQKLKIGYVRIGAGSFIGYSACVLPNVNIGKHCVIGALSVVNQDIPSYSVAVGVPVRVVKRYDFDRKEWIKIK